MSFTTVSIKKSEKHSIKYRDQAHHEPEILGVPHGNIFLRNGRSQASRSPGLCDISLYSIQNVLDKSFLSGNSSQLILDGKIKALRSPDEICFAFHGARKLKMKVVRTWRKAKGERILSS